MPEYRTDPIGGHTVIIAPERQSRPGAFAMNQWPVASARCPFCRGHESETPKEICTYPVGAPADDWQIRVVPNKYPALRVATNPGEPSGQHEVIIEAPDHFRSISQLSPAAITLLMQVYADRIRAMNSLRDIRHALVFKNHGPTAGATLEHAHSQILGMDRVPDTIERELQRSASYQGEHGSCAFCHELQRLGKQPERLVAENSDCAVYCPEASRLPYELCLIPKNHSCRFEAESPQTLVSLANLLSQTLQALESLIPSVCYNYLIHSVPFDTNRNDHYHWHMEIIPRLATPAGFEWGAGLFMNPLPPEQAAGALRNRM